MYSKYTIFYRQLHFQSEFLSSSAISENGNETGVALPAKKHVDKLLPLGSIVRMDMGLGGGDSGEGTRNKIKGAPTRIEFKKHEKIFEL